MFEYVVSNKIRERIIEFKVGERDSDNLPLECRTGSGVQKRTKNRRIEEDRN